MMFALFEGKNTRGLIERFMYTTLTLSLSVKFNKKIEK